MGLFGINTEKVRKDFEVFKNHKDLIYFDNACMTLRPRQVLESMNRYYNEFPACVGRSHHKLSKLATEAYDESRRKVSSFIGAKESNLIFTKNTTEGVNLVVNSFNFDKGDEVLILDKEHNSNLVPWQQLAKAKKIKLKIFKTNDDNTFDIDRFNEIMNAGIRLVSFGMGSNLDGVSIPAKEIVKIAHEVEAKVMFDGAQAAPHNELNVKKLDVDMLAFSGHKMCGPSGVGALYVKEDALSGLNPFMVGGDTVYETTYSDAKFEKGPKRFEAGLQNYAGFIGFGEACNYLKKIGPYSVYKHEIMLNEYLTGLLSEEIDSGVIELIGPKDAKLRGGIFSFNVKGMDPHQVAMMLDSTGGIAVRSGAHCCHSWFNARGINGSVRASFYFYNTKEEVDTFVDKLRQIIKLKD